MVTGAGLQGIAPAGFFTPPNFAMGGGFSPRTNFSNALRNTIIDSEAASPVIKSIINFINEIGVGRAPDIFSGIVVFLPRQKAVFFD